MMDRMRRMIRENRVFVVFLVVTITLMWAGIIWVYHIAVLNAPKVYSDGFGYYVYLPAVIFRDFKFTFVEGWEHPLRMVQVSGGTINKYPMGTAIMESPFFFVAHIISWIKDALTGGFTATGYSNLYQYAVIAGGAIYWAVATFMLYRLLLRYIGVSKRVSILCCFFITYGTNLFHYASYDACFSHIYSYTLCVCFLYYLCWYEEREKDNLNKIGHTCAFGLLAGGIFLVRNVNLLFIVPYILYGVRNLETLKDRLITVLRMKRVVPIVVTGLVTIMPQMVYWYSQTGHWIVYSYGNNESFCWLRPAILNFLFSIRKGLFFWNPILLVSVAGMIYAYKRKDKLYFGLTVFFLMAVYVSSSWEVWSYGGSYGQRVAVDFMCVFAVFMAYLFKGVEEKRKKSVCVGIRKYVAEVILYGYCIICVILNSINTLAYWNGIIPWDGATWEDIWNVFHWVM